MKRKLAFARKRLNKDQTRKINAYLKKFRKAKNGRNKAYCALANIIAEREEEADEELHTLSFPKRFQSIMETGYVVLRSKELLTKTQTLNVLKVMQKILQQEVKKYHSLK